VSDQRDCALADRLAGMVQAWCQLWCALLVFTDGWSTSPGRLRRAFREQVQRAGEPGRCRWLAWPEIVRGTVRKQPANTRVVEGSRRMAPGTVERAQDVLRHTRGGNEWQTAVLARFHGTRRERLASLTRRGPHAARRVTAREAGMWLVGCTSHCCWPPQEVRRRLAHTPGCKGEVLLPPAMAAGLTDHIWRVRDRLTVRITPPPWVAPKRRGRPTNTGPLASLPSSARPRPWLRLRQGMVCASTRERSPTCSIETITFCWC
jgi:hypothetical protein